MNHLYLRIAFCIICLILFSSFASAETVIDPSQIIFHFHGPDTTSRIGVGIYSIGDLNGDSFDDISMTCNSPYGSLIFCGGNPPDSLPDLFIDSAIFGIHRALDVSGNGFNDILALDGMSLHFYEVSADSISSVPFDTLRSDTIVDVFGTHAKMGFIDDDFYPDLIVNEERDTICHLYMYSGYYAIDKQPDWDFAFDDRRDVMEILLLDFNGDYILDIVAHIEKGRTDSGQVYIFFGPSPGASPDVIIDPPIGQFDPDTRYTPYCISQVGDFNGDGWDDLGYIYHGGSYWPLIYLCGPGADTLPDVALESPGATMSLVGDINNDSWDDVICGRSGDYRGIIFITLGGPEADSVFDDAILSSDLPNLALDNIGKAVSGAGDFNGDGIDDFMFSCGNFVSGEPNDVFVIAGSEDIIAGVDENDDQAMPEDYILRQNYPNPFNSGTMIEFTLPRSGHTEMTIINILGEVVAKPIAKQLHAGKHQVHWDGRDSAGRPTPTGAYFYRVTSGNFSETKKMILLK